MTDIVLKDADPILIDRIKHVADARGWTMSRALNMLLERGLCAVEGDGAVRFDHQESDVLLAAIAAMEQVPDDPGYAAIGRLASAAD